MQTENSSWMLGPFARPAANPILAPRAETLFDCPLSGAAVAWEALHLFNPAAVVKDGAVHLLYRAEDASGAMTIGGHTSRIGLATSTDGLHFQREAVPVLFPADDAQRANEWPGGCEDPRVVEAPDGSFVMTYTQWNRQIARLAIATSRDLRHWHKHGPAFAGHATENTFHKAGSMLTQVVDGRLQAVRHLGKFWMYWGENGIALATSDDLIHWTPGECVLPMRPGEFDSHITEAGPPAVLTEHGIVLLYNGMNAHGVPALNIPPRLYAAGQALFDINEPHRLLARSDAPFFRPEADFEKSGQYEQGTTFIEGLVYFQNRWLLYYGCADSMVAVAEAK